MGRLRQITKKLEKGYLNVDKGNAFPNIKVGTITATTATITTGTITTLTAPTLNASTARHPTRLTIPTTAYTGANAALGSIYATKSYMYLSIGATWKSEAFG